MTLFPPELPATAHARLWAERLRRSADVMMATLARLNSDEEREAYVTGFRDEFGHRRAVDEPLLRHLLDRPAQPPAGNLPIDERLWWCLASGEAFPKGLIATPAGPLTTGFGREPIEFWTERELRVLHAVTSRSIENKDAALLVRAMDAANWLSDNIQTDNATNRPWGIHSVIIRAALGHSNADHDAAGMVHAANAATGEADRLSQIIMLDAARALDRWIA